MSDFLNTTAKKLHLDSTSKVNFLQVNNFGVQSKSEDSAPATKAELWNTYQQAKQLNQNGTNRSSVPILQTKLTIGQPGDKYEQEADSVADRVMAMPETGLATSTVNKSVQIRSSQPIQRVCTDCQEDTQEESQQEGEEDRIQAKEAIGQTPEITTTSAKIAKIPNDPTIQRDSPSNLPPIPNYQLTTPSLGQPQDPSSRYKLGGDLSLHLDPQFQSTMQQVQEQVTPTTIRTALGQIKLALPPSGTPAPAANPLAMPSKPAPAASPTVPAGDGPDKPHAVDGGDIMDAILAVPAIEAAVDSLKTQASDRITQDWQRLKTGEKILGVSSVVAIGGGLLAGVMSDPAARKLALDQLNGKVLPVPKLNWLHLEINTGGDNLMLGLHVDVGQLLPASWGFKASSPDAIGGVPEPDPFPVQRKLDSTEDALSNSDLESRLNSSKGSGSPLTNEIRGFMEPRFGTDFSGVRVHTGSNAMQMNRDVNAQAFAHGSDIYFGAGKAPGKDALTAHELTHVVQQTGSIQQKLDLQQDSRNPNRNEPLGFSTLSFGRIQCYDAYEHAQAGDRAKGGGSISIQGIDVTAGEINALADLYENPVELQKADPSELKQLLGLIRKQKADPKSVSEADWDKATNGRYNQLNLKNSKHFSPSNPALMTPQSGSAGNQSTWEGYHKQALAKAREAVDAQPPAVSIQTPLAAPTEKAQQAALLEEAKIINFFGEHYLTDAFSAGHLFNKDDTVAAIQKNLGALSKEQLGTVFDGVAASVWAAKSSFISTYEGKKTFLMDFWGDLNSVKRFKSVLEGIYEQQEGKSAFHSAIVKAAHDRLNTQKNDDGSIGVPVKNDFEEWSLAGDRTLATSPITQKWLNKALEQSRTNLLEASQSASTAPDEEKIKRISACLPRPTENSTKAIHDLLEKVTNPTGGMVEAISAVLAGEIESTFQAVADKGYIRKKKGK